MEWNHPSGLNKSVPGGSTAETGSGLANSDGRGQADLATQQPGGSEACQAAPTASDASLSPLTCHNVWNSIIRETSGSALRMQSWGSQAAATSAP